MDYLFNVDFEHTYDLYEWGDIQINNEINKRLNKLSFIDDYVEIHFNISSRIINKIWSLRKDAIKYCPKNTEGVNVRYGSFKMYIYPDIYTVYYQLYNFREKKFYDEYSMKVDYIDNSYNKDDHTLYISLYAVSGVIKNNNWYTINKLLFGDLGVKYDEEYNDLYSKLLLNYLSNRETNTFEIIKNDPHYIEMYNKIKNEGIISDKLSRGRFSDIIDNVVKIIFKAQLYSNSLNDIRLIFFNKEFSYRVKNGFLEEYVSKIQVNKPEYYAIFL